MSEQLIVGGKVLLQISGQRGGKVFVDVSSGQLYSILGCSVLYKCAVTSFKVPTGLGPDDRQGVSPVQRAWKEAKSVADFCIRSCRNYLVYAESLNVPHNHPVLPRCYHVILLLRWEARLRLCELLEDEILTVESIPIVAREISESVVLECPFVLPCPYQTVELVLRRMVREYAAVFLTEKSTKSHVNFRQTHNRVRYNAYLNFLKQETTYWDSPELRGIVYCLFFNNVCHMLS